MRVTGSYGNVAANTAEASVTVAAAPMGDQALTVRPNGLGGDNADYNYAAQYTEAGVTTTTGSSANINVTGFTVDGNQLLAYCKDNKNAAALGIISHAGKIYFGIATEVMAGAKTMTLTRTGYEGNKEFNLEAPSNSDFGDIMKTADKAYYIDYLLIGTYDKDTSTLTLPEDARWTYTFEWKDASGAVISKTQTTIARTVLAADAKPIVTAASGGPFTLAHAGETYTLSGIANNSFSGFDALDYFMPSAILAAEGQSHAGVSLNLSKVVSDLLGGDDKNGSITITQTNPALKYYTYDNTNSSISGITKTKTYDSVKASDFADFQIAVLA